METSEIQAKQAQELQASLWDMANDLRGNMDPSEFKSYILGLIFYKYLCDKELKEANGLLADDHLSFEEAWTRPEFQEGEDGLKKYLIKRVGYCIEPQFLFSTLIGLVNTGKFSIDILAKGIAALTDSTQGAASNADFNGLFDDLDLYSNKLGKGEADKSKLIGKILVKINDLEVNSENSEIDVLGDAYEYLIGKFAASAGKKAGEFYTPQQIGDQGPRSYGFEERL
jgi:type I restriction enzyme M protein